MAERARAVLEIEAGGAECAHCCSDLARDGLGRAHIERPHRDLLIALGPTGRAPPPFGTNPVPHDLVGRPKLGLRLRIGFRDMPRRVDADRKRLMPELLECAVVELDVRREAARVAPDDGERERKTVPCGAHHRPDCHRHRPRC